MANCTFDLSRLSLSLFFIDVNIINKRDNLMAKKILFVIDKLELKYFEFNNLVTDFWLIKELLLRGNEVFVTTIDKLSLKENVAQTLCYRSYEKDGNIFYDKDFQRLIVESFDQVLFRPDPPVDLDYINATYVLDFVDETKTLVINKTSAVRNFNEKLHTNLFSEFMPKNIVSANAEEIQEFLNENEEIILKPLNKCFGSGVMYLKNGDFNTNTIINTMTNNQSTLTMVQKYIPQARFGDKRVLILGDEVLEECVVKLPGQNDFKFNTHSDSYIKKATLSNSEKEKFSEVAKKLNSQGIYMAGLDVVDEQIIETNVTSPCYFIKEINNYFSTKLEERIVDYLLTKTCVSEFCHK